MNDGLTEVELLTLAALAQLGPDAYGVTIAREIERRAARSVSVGSLYKTIRRLEGRGFVSTRVGAPTATRGGRAKKHIRIESPGLDALRTSIGRMNRMVEGLGFQVGEP